MIYGYSSNRFGTIFTHLVGFDEETLEKMEKHSHRFDDSIGSHKRFGDNSPILSASFVHLNENRYDAFIKDFEIHLVDSKKELQFLKKLLV